MCYNSCEVPQDAEKGQRPQAEDGRIYLYGSAENSGQTDVYEHSNSLEILGWDAHYAERGTIPPRFIENPSCAEIHLAMRSKRFNAYILRNWETWETGTK